jgi:hypothetical protein
MNKITSAVLAIALAALGGAALWSEPRLAVKLEAGPSFVQTHWFGPVPAKMPPQIAIWIERADGSFVDTIYVTRTSATEGWKAAGGARRPEALPVWSHARGVVAADGLYMPDKSQPLPDAVSGATPKGDFAKAWAVPAGLQRGSYVVKVELNLSYDWNAAYPDRLPQRDARYSECNGQPSIVWAAKVEIGGDGASASLKPLGSGALRGEDGAVRPGLDGLTSAKEIAASIVAEYRP